MARAARFFQPAINAEEDSDSDSESGTSSKISEEDIVIKERESLNKVHKIHSYFNFSYFCKIRSNVDHVEEIAMDANSPILFTPSDTLITFIYWIATYPLDKVIRSSNNLGQALFLVFNFLFF